MGLNSIARAGQRLYEAGVNRELAKLAQQYGNQVGKVNNKGWAAFEKMFGDKKVVTTIDLRTGKVRSLYDSSGNITRNINYTRFDEHGAVEMFRHTKKGTGFYCSTNSLSNTGDISGRYLGWNTVTGNGTLTKTLNGKTTVENITMPVKNQIM
ncbi:MAG: hypothetical protein MJ230_00495 [bacterium]|nr:hypothetical protein [bacterium]